jgi:hypothetical protein
VGSSTPPGDDDAPTPSRHILPSVPLPRLTSLIGVTLDVVTALNCELFLVRRWSLRQRSRSQMPWWPRWEARGRFCRPLKSLIIDLWHLFRVDEQAATVEATTDWVLHAPPPEAAGLTLVFRCWRHQAGALFTPPSLQGATYSLSPTFMLTSGPKR